MHVPFIVVTFLITVQIVIALTYKIRWFFKHRNAAIVAVHIVCV